MPHAPRWKRDAAPGSMRWTMPACRPTSFAVKFPSWWNRRCVRPARRARPRSRPHGIPRRARSSTQVQTGGRLRPLVAFWRYEMIKVRGALLALGIASGVLLPAVTAPASAAVDTSDPQRFVQTLTTDGFAAMRSGNREAAKAKFRALLAQNVAVDQIGDRLIRRSLPTITPAQRAAYKSALPGYVVGTYADRLFEYASASIRVVRAQPTAGGGA